MGQHPFNKINIFPLKCKLYGSVIPVELETVTANIIGYFIHIYLKFLLLKNLCKGVLIWAFFAALHIWEIFGYVN